MMGQRTIETVLRVQNESEYKAALKNCSSELKVMKSELDKVTSDFRTNANSIEALTKKGEVLSKMYDAQQKKVELLRGAMSKAQETRDAEEQTVNDLRAQYEQAQKTLTAYANEFGKSSEQYQTQKIAVDNLRDSVIKHQAKLDASTKSYNYYASQLNKAEVELNNLSDQQEENSRLMDESKKSADGCATSIDKYGDAVRDAAEGTGKTTSAVEAMASAMVASGIKQKVDEVAAALKECSQAAQEYEHSIAQVSTIADESVISTQDMRQGVMQLSEDLRQDVNDVSDAVYNALSAGVQTADVLNFIAQSAQLTRAGFTDMSTSVDVLTTIMNAYRLEADKTENVASTLVKTQDLGKITVDQLGKVIGRVIPSAAAYGVNLDNIAAAYARMTSSGINAENTTTYLSTMLDELADSGSTVAGILREKTGKSFSELMGEGRSLGDVLNVLGSSVEYDKAQFTNLWSSATAGRAAVSLFNDGADAFNRTLNEMANSSGTVAKNYEKMTDTSEYSSQRLSVACSNLKIAIGSQLNPALDQLRESGAGALEIATDFIVEHPAVVSAISGVVTALGLLAGGLSALMIAKSAAAAMTALNISLAANPFVLVATAVVGLVAALATYAAQIETTQDKVDALTESARTLSDTVADGNTGYEDSMVAVEAASSTVDRYIDRLEELEEQGLETDAQQAEYSMILDKINSVMPGINAELDAQSDLVKGGTKALREQADAWANNAKLEAAYTRYKDDIAAVTDAEYELAVNTAKLNLVKDEEAAILKQLEDLQDRTNDLTRQQQELYDDTSLSVEEYNERYFELNQQLLLANDSYFDLSNQLAENQKQQEILGKAVAEGEEALAANSAEVEASTQAYESLKAKYGETADAVSDGSEQMSDATTDAMQKMQKEYDDLYASARDSLDRQIGLFDDLSGKCEMSMDQMIENLRSQQRAFDNYATNIQLAMERGIDMGLIRKLSDGSAESMQILEVLVNGSEEQITELNDVLSGVSVSKDDASAAMAQVAQNYEDALREASASVVDAAYEAGANVGQGYIGGFNSKRAGYKQAARLFADAGILAYKERNLIQSPSKRWAQLAQWDVAAPLKVYKEAVPKMQSQAKELADAGYLGAIRSKQAAIPSLVSAASAIPSGLDNSRLYQLLQQILAGIQAGKKLVIYPDVLVGETVDRYDAALGQNKLLADRGAK